jgi:hypothetical protein
VTSEFLPGFSHFAVRTEKCILVQSVCTKCGASRLVSVADGSLKNWEVGHICSSAHLKDNRFVKTPDTTSV